MSPGPKRLHYPGAKTPRWLEVWGRIVEESLAVLEFEEID